MLEFAQSWGWITKSFVAMFLIIPMMVFLPMFEHRFGLKAEGFFIAWFFGCFVGFLVLGKMSSTPLNEYISPIWPFMAIVVAALIIGSTANILLVQAMSTTQAPNPALPFAIVNLAGTFAYIIAWGGGRFLPTFFPKLEFSIVNVAGLLLIAVGISFIMYQAKQVPGS